MFVIGLNYFAPVHAMFFVAGLAAMWFVRPTTRAKAADDDDDADDDTAEDLIGTNTQPRVCNHEYFYSRAGKKLHLRGNCRSLPADGIASVNLPVKLKPDVVCKLCG